MGDSRAEHQYIAVVDDDADVRKAIRAVLNSAGIFARTFASAEEFIQSTERFEATCLIADLQMPGMNGLELLKALRAAGQQIPTIFITAFDDAAARQAALTAGAAAFLEKPLDDHVLLDRVRTALLP